MPQTRQTALPRHQKKERWGTNKDNTNTTYETTDTQTKKNCDRRTVLEWSVGKTAGETSPLVLMQFLMQIHFMVNVLKFRTSKCLTKLQMKTV